MKIAVIGSGYVGLVTGACFSEFGFNVTCVDKDTKKIEGLQQGLIPIYEPGLEVLVQGNTEKGRLSFTTNLGEAVRQSTVVFIAVGTPADSTTGHADMQYVYGAAEEIALNICRYTVIVTKSTVPVGTAGEITKIIKKTNPAADFDVVSNPEFLREGSAIEDFMRPNRVVIGCESSRAQEVMQSLYRPLYLLETPMVYTDPVTSELIKYASNAFLATKISFINQMADLCEQCGADIKAISKGMGLDNRIGSKFLHAGPGYGGSCFPKDTLALLEIGKEYQALPTIVSAVVAYNQERKTAMAQKVIGACGGAVKDKKIAILGLTFKPNTDDMRDSPSLDIIPVLLKEGAQVQAFDPQGMDEAKHHFGQEITYASSAYEAMDQADALVIITEWNEFRALDLGQVKALLKTPLIVDLRNIYTAEEVKKYGFSYHSIGRKSLNSQKKPKIAAVA